MEGWKMGSQELKEVEPSEAEASMRADLSVTFSEKGNTYRMNLRFDGLTYNVHFSKTHGGGREEGIVVTFLQEDLYAWIANEPMLNAGGMYGICFYANEARNAPKWVRKFAHCFA